MADRPTAPGQAVRLLTFTVLAGFIWAADGAGRSRAEAATADAPNIVVIVADDLAARCLDPSVEDRPPTPAIDALAAEGVTFSRAFTTTSICACSRGCLLTGQHMRRHGIRDFDTPLSTEAWAATYPAILRRAGYRTGYFGKFGIGSPHGPNSHLALPADAFDDWLGFPQEVDYRQPTDDGDRYLTTLLESRVERFLVGHPRGRPFCLTLGLKEPHGPRTFFDPEVAAPRLIPPQPPATLTERDFSSLPACLRDSLAGKDATEWLRNPSAFREWRVAYDRLVARADLAVGRVVSSLERHGFSDDTIVIVTSDNGHLLGAHGLSGKWLMYEESIRVPFMIRDPRLPADRRGGVSQRLVLGIDLAPTIVAMAGLPADPAMQGRDLSPLLRGEPGGWRESFYYEHTFTPREGPPIPRCEGVRGERWKFVRYGEADAAVEQLFDIDTDPLERHDLAGNPDRAETLAGLRSRCDALRDEAGPAVHRATPAR